MTLSLTRLRANLYQVVDQVIETGIPAELERHGHRLQIVALEPKSKLANLKPHPGTIVGDPEDMVQLDWSAEWNQDDH